VNNRQNFKHEDKFLTFYKKSLTIQVLFKKKMPLDRNQK